VLEVAINFNGRVLSSGRVTRSRFSALRLLEPDKGILNAQAVHLLTVSEVFRE
jgi:hypothetical protein